jgi:hypothetical protein
MVVDALKDMTRQHPGRAPRRSAKIALANGYPSDQLVDKRRLKVSASSWHSSREIAGFKSLVLRPGLPLRVEILRFDTRKPARSLSPDRILRIRLCDVPLVDRNGR